MTCDDEEDLESAIKFGKQAKADQDLIEAAHAMVRNLRYAAKAEKALLEAIKLEQHEPLDHAIAQAFDIGMNEEKNDTLKAAVCLSLFMRVKEDVAAAIHHRDVEDLKQEVRDGEALVSKMAAGLTSSDIPREVVLYAGV